MRTAHPNELRFGTQLKSLEIHLPNMKKIGWTGVETDKQKRTKDTALRSSILINPAVFNLSVILQLAVVAPTGLLVRSEPMWSAASFSMISWSCGTPQVDRSTITEVLPPYTTVHCFSFVLLFVSIFVVSMFFLCGLQGLQAGDNTLNILCSLRVARTLVSRGFVDVSQPDARAAVLSDYVHFLSTPGSHKDTYAESFHRSFFADWQESKPTSPHEVGQKQLTPML